MERLKVTISPNREIRVSVGLATRGGKRSQSSCEQSPPNTCPELAESVDSSGDGAPPSKLDISPEFQRRPKTVKSGWGDLPKKSRFGTEQKRLMLRAGAVCDQKFGVRQVIMTGTLPGNTNEANYALACWSGYAMNRLQQWIRRVVDENWSFGVWEYQQRGALHFHLAVCYKSKDQATILEKGFRRQWIKILQDISEQSGVDLFDSGRGFSWHPDSNAIQADAQTVRKSCAAYFAKYATKSYCDDVAAEMQTASLFQFCPSRWVVCSRAVSRAIKEATFEYTIEGSRQDIEKRIAPILQLLDVFDCKKFAYNHKVIAGRTHIFYFPGWAFKAMSESIKRRFEARKERTSGAMNVDVFIAQDAACRRYLRRYGDPKVNWRAAILRQHLQGKLTEKGEAEFRALWSSVNG